jgi:hypothetical protein
LDLPPDAKIHPRFHVKLLEPADPETPLQETFYYETEEDDEFDVEDLRGYRETGRNDFQDDDFYQEWLVKWKGYPESENTWEPEANLQNCQQLLRKYRKQNNIHYYTGRTKPIKGKPDEIKFHNEPATTQGSQKEKRTIKKKKQAHRQDSRAKRGHPKTPKYST